MSLDDIRFEDRDKYRTERANTTVKYITAPTKTAGGVGQGLMPYILAGSIGLGGGGFAGNALQEKITPTQLQAHIDRVVDKLERSEERIKEKLEDLEKELDDVRDKLEHHPAYAADGQDTFRKDGYGGGNGGKYGQGY